VTESAPVPEFTALSAIALPAVIVTAPFRETIDPPAPNVMPAPAFMSTFSTRFAAEPEIALLTAMPPAAFRVSVGAPVTVVLVTAS
jgi:hypothetical protein